MKDDLTVLTRYMAREFSKRGIRVNSVAPGSTRTRIAGDAFARFSGSAAR
jgi:NAD(P)-dependent dehydrogenase (short-subunit alcohol dehydrogenase family)